MKKYFLSFFAIAMAIGFSAFTVSTENKLPKFSRFTSLYWHYFDGVKITSQVGTAPMDKPVAEIVSVCYDNPAADICAYGYTIHKRGYQNFQGPLMTFSGEAIN
jgi:hypothetical protein